MDLSPEDSLRLNVLLANQPLAIRIRESTMTVHGLTHGGESKIPLHPTGRDDQYLKSVKELISGQVLGSPGGYPVYLQRWARMGQMRDESLEQLLLLGEPEAVVAAVSAPGLTDELARRAWWAMEDADNARCMLQRERVATGAMGPELANYLIEHLPFETEPEKMMETVGLVLQPSLIEERSRIDLWAKAQRRPAYYVGFLRALPDQLPEAAPAHPIALKHGADLKQLAQRGNRLAGQVARALSAPGQAYLNTVRRVLSKPPNQDVLTALLAVVSGYFKDFRTEPVDLTLEELCEEARLWSQGGRADLTELRAISAEFAPPLQAARVLSGVGYGIVRPVLSGTTAGGSLMRRKLEPVVVPLLREIDALQAR